MATAACKAESPETSGLVVTVLAAEAVMLVLVVAAAVVLEALALVVLAPAVLAVVVLALVCVALPAWGSAGGKEGGVRDEMATETTAKKPLRLAAKSLTNPIGAVYGR